MVSGKHKSRSLRRVFRKTPGGRVVTHFKRRKPAKAKCAVCKKPLQAVARDIMYKVRNVPKSKKRPARPYAGMLCSGCMRKKILEKIIK